MSPGWRMPSLGCPWCSVLGPLSKQKAFRSARTIQCSLVPILGERPQGKSRGEYEVLKLATFPCHLSSGRVGAGRRFGDIKGLWPRYLPLLSGNSKGSNELVGSTGGIGILEARYTCASHLNFQGLQRNWGEIQGGGEPWGSPPLLAAWAFKGLKGTMGK